MKKNWEESGNFTKVRIQVMVSLSSLNITSAKQRSFKSSLALAKAFANRDTNSPPRSLLKKVEEFCDLLNEIGKDSVHMGKYRHDGEMLGDILYRIAKGYITSPDLRLAYLGKLAEVHTEANAHAEAALCRLHQAKLVAEFLMYKNALSYTDIVLPVIWNTCSPTLNEKEIAEEGCLREDGVCQGPEFSVMGLVGLLEQSLDHYKDAKMYETVNEVAKVLLPIYEKEVLFDNLAMTHKNIGNCFEELGRLTKSGKRLTASYFRVAFFGKKFGDLDGLEFVYKEKPATSLAEIAARFSDAYAKEFGEDFRLIQDSGTVDRSKIDELKAHVQVTYVEPYFEENDERPKASQLIRLSRFVFETPYTLSGKAHGSVDQQHKRKTVLTTESSFPHLKKRLMVVSRREIDLSPIEVSIEAIRNRNTQLRTAVEANPPNAKNLQIVLQGSVRLQVNAGPLEIARVFLSEESIGNFLDTQVQELKRAFQEFVNLCQRSLELNKELIASDQVEYHEDLMEGYRELRKILLPLLRADCKGADKLVSHISPKGLDLRQISESILSFVVGPQASGASPAVLDFLRS
ncbi:Dock7 protein [Gonapodya prolifera JEL478]|uniref:Dock7 protein n=1 Tax=Gonapodya prolifera (strain JEL478) TaxID=1344416 RepID=A0A139AYV4_GONPJ|nr:Dock7 protein [Gonapodya prolifera JEL478]|eukprot:KXS21645.1 Dock7 protein [Gonapodya prolifera JEL478]